MWQPVSGAGALLHCGVIVALCSRSLNLSRVGGFVWHYTAKPPPRWKTRSEVEQIWRGLRLRPPVRQPLVLRRASGSERNGAERSGLLRTGRVTRSHAYACLVVRDSWRGKMRWARTCCDQQIRDRGWGGQNWLQVGPVRKNILMMVKIPRCLG